MSRLIHVILLSLFISQLTLAADSLSVFKKRKLILGTSTVALTAGSLVYLNQAWYQSYNSSKFHTFNDNAEWLHMDKLGHAFTTYQTGRLMMDALHWAGCSKKTQLLLGGLSGFAYMSMIEVMDGYSEGWGFSWGDMIANTAGSGFAIGQKLLWNEQRIQLKFSFFSSPYAKYRTNLLGKSWYEQILKDYNGQTYWLSINPSSFLRTASRFPKWLNIAFGYGANGMVGARNNNQVVDTQGNPVQFNRYQQYYLSLDVDLTRIKTRSRVLKSVFSCINILKIPFPNLEWSERRFRFNYY